MSLPHRFDSPRLHLMLGELVLFARFAHTPYDAVPKWCARIINNLTQHKINRSASLLYCRLPFAARRIGNLIWYSTKPKGSAVYRINFPDKIAAGGAWAEKPVELVRFFEESYGDTGFFSCAKMPGKDNKEWAVRCCWASLIEIGTESVAAMSCPCFSPIGRQLLKSRLSQPCTLDLWAAFCHQYLCVSRSPSLAR